MNRIKSLLSFKQMSKETLTADFIAGITVAMLLIPQSMAYAELAGLPAYYGLYAAFLPVILSGLFGHLHQLGTGPVAMTSIITASVVSSVAAQGTDDYIRIALVLSLLVGTIRLLMGLLKMATLVNLISHPVTSGFTCAGALIIGLSQVSKIFGIAIDKNSGILGNLRDFIQLLSKLGETHVMTLIIGLSSIAVIILIKKFLPKVPAVLVAVVLSIMVSLAMGFESTWGGSVVGRVPEGLPAFDFIITDYSISEWGNMIVTLLPGAVVITLISFMEVLSVSKAVSQQTKQPLDLNRELIGQGISAIGGSFFGSYPVSGSFSRTAMNLMSGAKTGFSSIVTGLTVMILLLFFTPLLYHLPLSVLAASIIVAVVKLINFKPMIRSFRANKVHGAISFITFAGTLVFAPNIHYGVLLGVVLTIVTHLYEAMKPRAVILGRYSDGTLRDAIHYDLKLDDHLLIIRFDSSLNFLNISFYERFVKDQVEKHKQIKCLLLSCEGVNKIDSSGEWAFNQIIEDMQGQGIQVLVSGLKRQSLETLENTKLTDTIGASSIFRSTEEAIMKIKEVYTIVF